jgi:hypothetical protein
VANSLSSISTSPVRSTTAAADEQEPNNNNTDEPRTGEQQRVAYIKPMDRVSLARCRYVRRQGRLATDAANRCRDGTCTEVFSVSDCQRKAVFSISNLMCKQYYLLCKIV